MERRLGVTEAREKFSDVVDKVQHQGDTYVISRRGKPAAAVVPVEVYENWKQQRRTLFDAVRKMSAKHFNWDDAEWDGAYLNKKSGSSENKLRGFYVEVDGKRYQFRFAKPEPGLHIIMYSGPVSS